MKVFICQMCGHIAFDEAPENCPQCRAPKRQFKQNDEIFKESKEKSPEAEVKHVPSLQMNKQCELIPEKECSDVSVRIGETLHPAQENHFIQWIDCYHDGKFIERVKLSPNVYPASVFHLQKNSGKVTVVENCNIHGYWMNEINL